MINPTATQIKGIDMLLQYCSTKDKTLLDKALRQGQIDWGHLFYYADINGLLGYLENMTEGLEDPRVPFRIAVNLKNYVIKQKRRWTVYQELINSIISSNVVSEVPLLLKGSALKFTLYKDEAYLRNIGDIDILIDKKDVKSISNWLESQGFWLREGKNGPTAFKETTEDRYVVDIHLEDPAKLRRNPDLVLDIFQHNKISMNNGAFFIPSYEVLLVHACKHLCDHEEDFRKAFLQTELRLFWLIDIHLLLSKVNYTETVKLAEQMKWKTELLRGIWYSHILLNTNIPSNINVDEVVELNTLDTPNGIVTWPWNFVDRMKRVDRAEWLSEQLGKNGKRNDWYTAADGDRVPTIL
ncbi:nucleotidyltransferase family protein [Paenibacillus chitinolyticus]|uniref:nucleotidyltransferase family protein n=1 Tax=Paenibacillus chitinolyticus TaxID=79263 RepID=UPI0036DD6AA7